MSQLTSHALVSSSLSSLSSSITFSLQAQNLPFQQILLTLILLQPWTAFTITGPDRTYHASRFIFSLFFFNFSVLYGGLSLLHVGFLLHVKYTVSYKWVVLGTEGRLICASIPVYTATQIKINTVSQVNWHPATLSTVNYKLNIILILELNGNE